MSEHYCIARSIICAILCMLLVSGCSAAHNTQKEPQTIGNETSENKETEESLAEANHDDAETPTDPMTEEFMSDPVVIEADWTHYFNGFNGAAVIYDAPAMQYTVYNMELARTRRSPCSTFKIVSSLIALENGMIDPEHSTHTWSGEIFWNEKWNGDIDFEEAFRESCVWYFREVADEIGQELMQDELNKLMYGNCDISDWEGRLNTNNNNRVLTGFWLESSLLISPKEQTEVLERIFGGESVYFEETQDALKRVMLAEQNETECSLYGKTGMGMDHGAVVDAWYAGFAQGEEGNIYFCVYLGRAEDKNVSSAEAKNIAIRLVADYCKK